MSCKKDAKKVRGGETKKEQQSGITADHCYAVDYSPPFCGKFRSSEFI